jgi:hypothetical protein
MLSQKFLCAIQAKLEFAWLETAAGWIHMFSIFVRQSYHPSGTADGTLLGSRMLAGRGSEGEAGKHA